MMLTLFDIYVKLIVPIPRGSFKYRAEKITQNYCKKGDEYGFCKTLLTDTNRIPITEDFTNVNTYITSINTLEPDRIDFLVPDLADSDLEISKTGIKNSNISRKIPVNIRMRETDNYFLFFIEDEERNCATLIEQKKKSIINYLYAIIYIE